MNQSILGRVFAWLSAAYQHQQAVHRLSRLDDRIQRDIGLDRTEIPEVVGDGLPPMEEPVTRGRGPLPGSGFRLRPGTSRGALR